MKNCLLLTVLYAFAAGSGLPGWSPTASIQITTPQMASASIGISAVAWGALWGSDSGILFRLEPGLGGGKVHLGNRFAFSMAFMPLMHADITAAALYTWGETWGGLMREQTYFGVEMRVGTHIFLGTVGLYRHAFGTDEHHDWIVSAGAGLGI